MNFTVNTTPTTILSKPKNENVMYDLSIKTSFVHFRGRGLSIRKISEVMGINRTTLIQWNKELYTDIKIAERDEFERIFEKHFCDKYARVTMLSAELGACYEKFGDKEERTDNLTLLKEIELITKLLNNEIDDKRFCNMMEKAKVNKDYPIIVNDAAKLRSYDPDFEDPDESVFDWEDDELMKSCNEEEKAEVLKAKEIYEEAVEEADEKVQAMEEEDLLEEAKENYVIIPISNAKKSKRIINKKPDQNPTKMNEGKNKKEKSIENSEF